MYGIYLACLPLLLSFLSGASAGLVKERNYSFISSVICKENSLGVRTKCIGPSIEQDSAAQGAIGYAGGMTAFFTCFVNVLECIVCGADRSGGPTCSYTNNCACDPKEWLKGAVEPCAREILCKCPRECNERYESCMLTAMGVEKWNKWKTCAEEEYRS